MFIGHFALGFAAKPIAPRVSLATLFAAAQAPDLLWPVLVAAGVEHVAIAPGHTAFTPLEFISYPWSHSLVLVAVWALVFAGLHRFRTGNRRAGPLIAALVVSHWLLDYVSHAPDLPLVPGGARYGLGLWSSVPATVAVEMTLFAAGLWAYTRVTRPRGSRGRWALRSLVALMLVAYVANLLTVPVSVQAVWAGTLVGFVLLLACAAWTDRFRFVV